jgi:hypothetical protein
MTFPTANITEGSGKTVNTLPNAGQDTMANSLPVTIASNQSVFPVTSLSSASITNPTSVLTRPANTTAYVANQLIASSTTAGSVVVPSFAIATSAGGAVLSRVRLLSNVTSGWDGVSVTVRLWTAAPTYTNGDGGAYAVATGAAGWIASFLIALSQYGDGAISASQLTAANEMAIKLASGTTIYWDMQIMGAATPISGQTFTLTAELMN